MIFLKTFEGRFGQDRTVRELPRKPSPMWRAIYHGFRRWAKVSELSVAPYKRTEITLETDRIWVIRRSHSRRAWCAECGREVDMVMVKEAAALLGMTQPMLSQPLTTQPMLPGCGDSGGWHWSQAADGSPLVCVESVLKSM
jgi:hypothetical protein